MVSTVLTATASDIVNGALRLIGENDANQTTGSVEMKDGLEAFNSMVKSWQSQGLHLWTETEGILFLDVGRTDYLLGPSGDEATNIDDFIDTNLSSNAAAAETILTLTSTTGMLTGDFIGIELDGGTRQWTKIQSVDSTTQVTIKVALTGVAASANTVFTFTAIIPRPMRLLQLRRFTTNEDDEIEATKWSRQEYFAQPNKKSQGQINNWYYSPQLTDGRIYVWQTASNVNQVAKFTYERPIDISTDTADNPDFPAEWFRILKYNLAVDIAPEYRIPQDRLDRLTVKAEKMLQDVLGFDREPDSLNIQPVIGGN